MDRRSVGRFSAGEICGSARLDFAFGLSPSQPARAVDLIGLHDAFPAGNAARRLALYRLAVTNPPSAQDGAMVNSAARWPRRFPPSMATEPWQQWSASITP